MHRSVESLVTPQQCSQLPQGVVTSPLAKDKPSNKMLYKKASEILGETASGVIPSTISVLMYNGVERALHSKMDKFNTTPPCKVSKCIW